MKSVQTSFRTVSILTFCPRCRPYHSLPAADARFTVVMTPISLSEFGSFCRPFSTSLRSSRIVWIFVCPESSFQGFVSNTRVSSLKSVFSVFIRYESTLTTGMSTSSFFVPVFPVSLRLTGSSANVSVRFSVDDFVVSRFFMASCVYVRFSPLTELEAPGAIAVSGGHPCISSSSAGFSVGPSFSVSCTSGTASGGGARVSAARKMSNAVDFWSLWCFDNYSVVFF